MRPSRGSQQKTTSKRKHCGEASAPGFVRQGKTAEASTLAAEVVELLRPLDAPMYKIEAFIELGEALHTAGDPLGRWALEEAARLSDQKGIVDTAEKARELLGALASRAVST